MSRALIIQPEAKEDALDAREWYEKQEVGLGDAFLRDLELCLRIIQEHPEIARVVYRAGRKRKLSRFPHLVFYTVGKTKISIVQIVHGHRNPQLWKKRFNELD